MLPDIQSRPQVRALVERFYLKLLTDDRLAPFFDSPEAVFERLPLVSAYWDQLLLQQGSYRRHTMEIHAAIDRRRPFEAADFSRWLELFERTVDELYQGRLAERAKRLARRVADHMAGRVGLAE
ncbi:MAG: group III truncated hemoglobin [Pseudomonadota bacterium]|nr:group III truncated hemoglobin [Pseudomonadota bacterium]